MNKREIQYERTLNALRNSLDEIVSKDGFAKLTIRALCSKAGINHRTFYHYFSSKNDLIQDRARRLGLHFNEYYEINLRNIHSRDALKRYTHEYIEYTQTRILPMLIALEKSMLTQCENGKLEKPSTQKILKQIIETGILKGEITSTLTTENIFNFLQSFFVGIPLNFCFSAGESLPDKALENEIYKWIDSLYISH